MHRAHRAGGADDVDRVAGADLGALRNRGIGRRRIRTGGAGDADAAIVDAADLGLDRTAEGATALDDDQKAAGGDLGEEPFGDGRVGAEIDDIVEACVGLGGEALAVGEDDAAGLARQFVDHAGIDRRVADHQQPPARFERPALDLGIGALDAGPRLDQSERRGRQVLRRRDQHRLAFRRCDHPLVEQHVFLQAALEVVAEGGVGRVGRQPAIIGLDDEAFAELVALDAVADLDDAHHRFMAGNGRRIAGNVVRHLGQGLRRQAVEHARLAAVPGELLEQLEIGEAQADRLDLGEHLVRARLDDRLGRIEFELVGTDQLDGALRVWNVVHGGPFHSRLARTCCGEAAASIAASFVSSPGRNVRPTAAKNSFLAATDAKLASAHGLR